MSKYVPIYDHEADSCPFRGSGVQCIEANPDCARCGWFPAEEKRRILDLIARRQESREAAR